jgi:TolB protein
MKNRNLLPYLCGIIVFILLISTLPALGRTPQTVLLPITLKGAPVKPSGQVVFVSARTGNLDLFRMDYDGNNLDQLTESTYSEIDPDWSPDGSKIAYSSDQTGYWDIYVMDSDGMNPVQLTTLGNCYAPQWSPDGLQIAYYCEQEGLSQVYLMNSDGSDSNPITDPAIHTYSPYWSPDGNRIAYITNDASPIGVYAVDLDGNPAELLLGNWLPRSVAWSPDGRWLALSLNMDFISPTTDVVLYDLQTTYFARLTISTIDHLDVDWFPLGNYLIFWADYSSQTNSDVYTMTRTGTQLQNITNYPGSDMMGDWTP